jgi:hypothetical protein
MAVVIVIVIVIDIIQLKNLGQYSQNFLSQIRKIFITLGLSILRFFKTKSVFEANVIRVGCYLQ